MCYFFLFFCSLQQRQYHIITHTQIQSQINAEAHHSVRTTGEGALLSWLLNMWTCRTFRSYGSGKHFHKRPSKKTPRRRPRSLHTYAHAHTHARTPTHTHMRAIFPLKFVPWLDESFIYGAVSLLLCRSFYLLLLLQSRSQRARAAPRAVCQSFIASATVCQKKERKKDRKKSALR